MSSLRDRLRRQLGEPTKPSLEDDDPDELDETPEPPPPRNVGQRLHRLMRARSTRDAFARTAQEQVQIEAADRRAARRQAATEGLKRTVQRTDPKRPVTRPPKLPQREITNSVGSFLRGELHLDPEHMHGDLPLHRALEVDGAAAVLLSGDAALAGFDPTRALFFDLETTGLMGGSGNLAFLTGTLRVHPDGSSTITQYLLRHPGEEGAALHEIERELEDCEWLVSFNGKSFDRNVLADRFTMNRRPPDRVLELPHLDLLHPARRLFARTMQRCNLGSLEAMKLGVHRDELEEISGAEVPERWFTYLREDKPELLTPVLDHNALDLLTLATLAAHLEACVRAPGSAIPEPGALLGAAKLLLDRGEPERGEEVLQMVARGQASDPVVYGALSLLGTHLRRSDRHAEAMPLWQRMRDAAGGSDPEPWRRAAIALEWQLGEPATALHLVDEFLALVDGATAAALAPELEAMRRRRERLRTKVE
jgi:uncharacterized protein